MEWVPQICYLRWEFIKENKKVRKQENKNSNKKAIKKKNKKENKNSTKKATKKKEKLYFFLDHFLGRVLVFLLSSLNSHLRDTFYANVMNFFSVNLWEPNENSQKCKSWSARLSVHQLNAGQLAVLVRTALQQIGQVVDEADGADYNWLVICLSKDFSVNLDSIGNLFIQKVLAETMNNEQQDAAQAAQEGTWLIINMNGQKV